MRENKIKWAKRSWVCSPNPGNYKMIHLIEQVALKKSSLLLKVQKQNAQGLKLFRLIIKREIINKSN